MKSLDNITFEYAQHFSTYADVITGSAVTPMVAFLILLLQHQGVRKGYRNLLLVIITVVIMIVLLFISSFLVYLCHGEEIRLLGEINDGVFNRLEPTISKIMYGQLSVIGAAYLIGIGSVVWHYWSTEIRGIETH